MTEEHTDFYKGLAIYILPEGVTDYFDLVDFNEEPAQKGDQLFKKELHLYLDERDNRPETLLSFRRDPLKTRTHRFMLTNNRLVHSVYFVDAYDISKYSN